MFIQLHSFTVYVHPVIIQYNVCSSNDNLLQDMFIQLKVAAKNDATERRVPYGSVLRSKPWRNICVTNDHRYVRFVVNTIRPFCHAWHITEVVTSVTCATYLVRQENLAILEHPSSSQALWGTCCIIVNGTLCVMFFFKYCPSFDLRSLVTPLDSSNLSYNCFMFHNKTIFGHNFMNKWINIHIFLIISYNFICRYMSKFRKVKYGCQNLVSLEDILTTHFLY